MDLVLTFASKPENDYLKQGEIPLSGISSTDIDAKQKELEEKLREVELTGHDLDAKKKELETIKAEITEVKVKINVERRLTALREFLRSETGKRSNMRLMWMAQLQANVEHGVEALKQDVKTDETPTSV